MKKKDSFRISVIGTGYVGLVQGACLAKLGHSVNCVDSDLKKVNMLKAGKIPIYEPGLEALVHQGVKQGRLRFCSTIADGLNLPNGPAQVVFIAVGTPPRSDGSADLTSVENVAEQVALHMKEYMVVVDKSTVPVETGDWVERVIGRFNKRKIPFDVVSNPEFLREGTAIEDFMHPDRIVLGAASEQATKILKAIYAPLKAPVLVTDIKSAELIKHACNSFLATRVSFINSVANLCEKVGADVTLVAKGMGMDPRIGSAFLSAGIGFGGFCLPKDLEAFYWISQKKGYDFELLRVVKEVNEYQKQWVLRKLEEELWNLEGKNVGLLGLAFKPNTDDLRLAPSLDIIRQLQEKKMRVRAYDPVAMPKAKALLRGVEFAKNAYDCAKDADCLVLVAEWKEFEKLDFKKIKHSMRTPLLLDGRNLFDPHHARESGFIYRGVGR